MAELDLGRIKRNVGKMLDQGALDDEIEAYVREEGTTPDAVRAFKPQSPAGSIVDAAKDVAMQFPQGFNRGLDVAVNAPYNLIRSGAGFLGYDLPEAQPIFGALNTGVEPEGVSGRIAGSVGEAVGSSVAPAGAVYGMASRTATPLAANAGTLANIGHTMLEGVRAAPATAAAMDTASAVGSGVGRGLAKEAGAGDLGQTAAGFAGGMLPGAMAALRALTHLRPKQQLTQNELLDAGQRQNVPIPRAVAGGDTTKATAGALKEIPYVGTPIQQGYNDAVETLGERATQVSAQLGSGKAADAGEAAKNAMVNWTGQRSKQILKNAYDRVDSQITNNGMTRPLTETQKAVKELVRQQTESATTQNNKAIALVEDAINRPGGLTYEGVKGLRTVLGSYLDGSILPEPGTPMPALRRLYGALSDDLRETVKAAGGNRALSTFQRANTMAKAVAGRREQLAKIVGESADASPERVFSRLVEYAGTKGNANIQRLALARKTLGPQEWEEVQSAMVARLGRDPDDNFSPARFITGYGKISPEAKNVLFGGRGQLRESLDDIATISREFDKLAKLGNPSGTGRVNSLLQVFNKIGIAAAGALTATNPQAALTASAGLAALPAGRAFSRYLASPSTAGAVRQFSQTYLRQMRANGTATRVSMESAIRSLSQALAKEDGSDPEQFEAAIGEAIDQR